MKCNCYICGKEFDRKPALIKRAKHPVCSRECQSILKQKDWVETKCCICGKEFIVPVIKNDRYSKAKTCSSECKKLLLSNNSKKSIKQRKPTTFIKFLKEFTVF